MILLALLIPLSLFLLAVIQAGAKGEAMQRRAMKKKRKMNLNLGNDSENNERGQ
jgi:hypothetical protein